MTLIDDLDALYQASTQGEVGSYDRIQARLKFARAIHAAWPEVVQELREAREMVEASESARMRAECMAADIDSMRSDAVAERDAAITRAVSCDHGLTFDEVEARQLLEASPPDNTPLGFIMGSPAAGEVRRRWPRGDFTIERPCPKGCGYEGIAYVSEAHYLLGDW